MTKTQKTHRAAMSAGLAIAFSSTASAAVIAGWDNNDAVHGEENWASTYTDASLNSSTITTGAGIDAKTTAGGPGVTEAMKYTGNASTSFAEANTNGAYLSFTIGATSGNTFDVTSVQIADINFNAVSEMQWELRSSVDSFATAFGTTTVTSDAAEGIELFSPTGITGETSVEFRLYSWWSTGGGASTNIHLRDDKTVIGDFGGDFTGSGLADPIFVVNGSVAAVPEPSSTALLGLGGLALILRRRK